jgi:hypothetical protein
MENTFKNTENTDLQEKDESNSYIEENAKDDYENTNEEDTNEEDEYEDTDDEDDDDDNSYYENNITELCEKIFMHPPRDPCTVCLYLDRNIAVEIPKNEHAMYMFEILVQILFGGIRILFGETKDGKISLGSVTEDEFALLQKYFQMMEYNVKFEIHGIDDKPNYPEFDCTDFSTLYLKFIKIINDTPMYVSIHFEHFTVEKHIPLHLQVKQQYNDTTQDDLPYF